MSFSDVLRRVVYEVRMDTSGVPRDLRELNAEVDAEMRKIGAMSSAARIDADKDEFDAKIKEARAQLAALKKLHEDPSVGMNDEQFQANLKRIKTQIIRLKGESANVSVRMDEKGQFSNDTRRVGKGIKDTDNLLERLGKRITSTRVNIGPFTANLRTLTAALSTLAPILVDVGGGIVAVGASLTEAAAGGLAVGAAGFAGLALSAGGAALAIKPVITDMKTASTAATALRTAQLKYGKSSKEAQDAQKALNSTLQGMPPAASRAVKAWSALKASFAARTQGIRQDFFATLSDGIRSAKALLPTFARDSTAAFHTASQGVQDWLKGLRSPEAQHILDTIMSNFNKALPDVLHGLGQFATGLARIGAEASKFLPQFTRGFDQIGTDFAKGTQNGEALHKTIGGLVSQTHSWFALLGATGRLLVTIFTGGAKAGQGMVDDLTQSLNAWNKQLQTVAGQKSLHNFFTQAATTTEQFAGVLRRAITLLFSISRITQPLASGVLLFANALGDVVTALSGLTGGQAILEGIGTALATYFVASKIVPFVKTLIAIPGAIRAIGASATIAEAEINPLLGLLSLAAGAIAALYVQFGSSGGSADDFHHSVDKVKQSLKDAKTASKNYAQATKDVNQAHDAAKRTAQKEHDAEQRLMDVRKKYGPDSAQAIKAEDNLARATDKHRQAVNRLKIAERVSGAEKKIAMQADEAAAQQQLIEISRQQQWKKTLLDSARAQGIKNLSTKQAKQLNEMLNTSDNKIANAQKQLNNLQQTAAQQIGPKFAGSLDKVTRSTGKTEAAIRAQTRAQNSQRGETQADLRENQRIADALGTTSQKTQNATKQTQEYGSQTKTTTGDISDLIQKLGQQSQKQDSTGRGAGNLGDAMHTLGRTLGSVAGTSRGMGSMIGAVTNKILNSFGAKQLHFSLPNVGSLIGGLFQRGGEVQRQATGGFTVPGSGDGDRYRTALPVGSFVMNRRATEAYGLQGGGLANVALESGERVFYPSAVNIIGADTLRSMNSSVPRFAGGGSIGNFTGMKPDIVALAKNIIKRFGGYQIAGRVDHSTLTTTGNVSLHSLGEASDIVPDDWEGATRYVNSIGSQLLEGIHASPPGSNVSWKNGQQVPPSFWGGPTWAEHHSHIHVATAQAIKSLAARIKAIAVKGPAGPLRDALQGQADTLRAAANHYIQQHMPRTGPEMSVKGGFHGQLLRGKVSWFTGGSTAGGGNASTDPGIAVNLNPGTDSGWNNPTTQHWMDMARAGHPEMADVKIGSHEAALPVIDLGPAGFTGRAIDVTGPGVRKLGMSTSSFPTDSIGSAHFQQRGGFVGMQKGGQAGPPSGHGHGIGRGGRPGGSGGYHPSQTPKLPPQPHRNKRHDYGTGPGSWYDWYSRAIDFYDSRGDARNDKGYTGRAKIDWLAAQDDIVSEEKQVHRIIQHDKDRIKKIERTRQPKSVRNLKPKPFKAPKRKHGESHKDYHKRVRNARQAYHQKVKAWHQAKRAWEKQISERSRSVKQELPDLYQQLRTDLPNRWKDIQAKIKGQAADRQLEQTEFGTERYDALLAFGGNFSALGFGVGGDPSRFGGSSFGVAGGLGRSGPVGPTLTGSAGGAAGTQSGLPTHAPFTGRSAGLGLTAPQRAAGGGQTVQHVDNSKTIHITQRYEREPKDPHTWSASMRHELGALA